jgi:hypothetical protein
MHRNSHGHGLIEEALQVSFVCVCCECFQEDGSAVSDLTECTAERRRGEEGWVKEENEMMTELTEDRGEEGEGGK